MLVSAVIPAFNAEAFVGKAITSVLSQTHETLELVVVDDGSTDGTASIAASFFDPRMRVVSQRNSGTAAARNRGLELVSGELVAFLDADDRWDPQKLAVQIQAMRARNECVAMGCLMRYESPSGKILGIAGQEVGHTEQDLTRRGLLMPFPISSALFLRDTVVGVGGFDETLRRAQDLDLLARVALQGEIAMVPRDLGVYLIHSESVSARDIASQKMTTRFIRARLKARAQGDDLTWEEFRHTYRPSMRQRYGDFVQARYRRTGLLVGEGRWVAAAMSGAFAALLGPRYTVQRFVRQRSHKRK